MAHSRKELVLGVLMMVLVGIIGYQALTRPAPQPTHTAAARCPPPKKERVVKQRAVFRRPFKPVEFTIDFYGLKYAGNSGNLSSHYLYVDLLRRAGCEVFALDYSGFGESDGRPCVASLAADANAACDAARAWSRELGAGETVGLFGLSVGSNLALLVASERDDISGVAVEGVQVQREMIRRTIMMKTPVKARFRARESMATVTIGPPMP